MRIFLPSVSIFSEGYNFAVHVSSTMASLMLSRHRSLFLESLPAGCTRGYASCVHRESSVSPQHALPRAALLLNTHFHVLRADCWCSSAAHTPSTRCACRAMSPELDCSGRCLAGLYEPCFRAHRTNSTPVKLLVTRSIKLNNVTPLLKAAFSVCGFLSRPPVPLCGSSPLRERPGTCNTTPWYYCYCVIIGSR